MSGTRRRSDLGARSGVAIALGLATTLTSASALALRIAPRRRLVNAEASTGQRAMTVGVDDEGFVRAATCAHTPCDLATGARLPVPAPFAQTGFASSLELVQLAGSHRAVVVALPDGQTGRTWIAVVVAPKTDGPARVLFGGVADLVRGELGEGLRAPAIVQILPGERGASQVVVGTRSDEIELCGRPAVLSPRALDPDELSLVPTKVLRPSTVDRGRAKRLVAARREGAIKPPLGRLLSAVGASSAIGAPQALTDGDLDTSWSEGRAGDGRGEFVTMRAPKEVPLVSLGVAVRPRAREVDAGAAPRRLYVMTDAETFELVLPEDGFQHAGTFYDVRFPEPVTTGCLAVVLDEAYTSAGAAGRKAAGDPSVTLTEVEARSSFDDGGDVRALAAMLSGGDRKARAAAAVLVRGGEPARLAVTDAYGSLDDAGRMLALDVADQGPCEASAPLYVRALATTFPAESSHARARLERCRRGSVRALVAAIGDTGSPARFVAADELSVIAPDEAVTTLSRLFSDPDARAARAFRQALGRAAGAPRSAPAVARVLDDPSLDVRTLVRLLVTTSARLGDDEVRPAAARALARASGQGVAFDERWLALGPAATLAARGDAGGEGIVRAALADPNPFLRAEAARVAGPIVAMRAVLLGLARDPDPRVREAVAVALRTTPGPDAADVLLALARDEWTFVRSGAYDALAVAPPEPRVDAALVTRLGEDASPLALPRAIDAVSARGVAAAAPSLRALFGETRRPIDVRVRAVRAIGGVCDRTSVDALSELAARGASRTATGEDQALAGAALVALGRLAPPDLATRLAPFRGEGVPRPLAGIAESARTEKDRCP